jgi:acetylornithine deacetylase/succinyl-diaminopimelate desuccinylase-like protein
MSERRSPGIRSGLSLITDVVSVDEAYLWELFERFVAADTSVRPDENRVDPQDERVRKFATDIASPELTRLGALVEIDELNNVIGRFGSRTSGREFLLISYPVTHHANQMAEPLRARQRLGQDGERLWVGRGAGQGKAGLAAVCAAVRLLVDHGVDLEGVVTLIVSSEGSSTHESARSFLRRLSPLPAGAILTNGTENRISLGNRGRIDIVVEIAGRSTHSSVPDQGLNPIPWAAEVLQRVGKIRLDATPHPKLGSRSLVPYKLTCGPVAPHTIPSSCTVVFDQRLLPGDSSDDAVDEIAAALRGLPVSVRKGPEMLPSLVPESAAVVLALQEAGHRVLGKSLEVFYPPFTFDAGYFSSVGVPAVMFGPSSSELSASGVLGEDAINARAVVEAAAVYAGVIACNADDLQAKDQPPPDRVQVR